MIKKLLTNTLARKSLIFAVVFVMAVVSMGTLMPGGPGDLPAMQDSVGVSETLDGILPQELKLSIPDTGPPLSMYPQEALWELAMRTPDFGALKREEGEAGGEAGEELPDTEPAVFAYKHSTEWPIAAEGFRYLSELPLSEELQRYTHARCVEQGIDYTLVLALMWRESNFQTQAVGYNDNGTKDSGIMQINDVNREWLHRELAIDNLLDPYQNIDAGTEILGRFTEKYGQHDALLAYQYGESGMRRKLEEGVTTNGQIERLYRKKAEFDELLVSAAG